MFSTVEPRLPRLPTELLPSLVVLLCGLLFGQVCSTFIDADGGSGGNFTLSPFYSLTASSELSASYIRHSSQALAPDSSAPLTVTGAVHPSTSPTSGGGGNRFQLETILLLYVLVPSLSLVVLCVICVGLCLCFRRYRRIRRLRQHLLPLHDMDGSDSEEEEEDSDDSEAAFTVVSSFESTQPILKFADT